MDPAIQQAALDFYKQNHSGSKKKRHQHETEKAQERGYRQFERPLETCPVAQIAPDSFLRGAMRNIGKHYQYSSDDPDSSDSSLSSSSSSEESESDQESVSKGHHKS